MLSRRAMPVLALLLAGCGWTHVRADAFRPVPARPSELVGLWRVDGPAIASGTYLKFEVDQNLTLFTDCGAPFGRWRAVPGGAFTANLVVGAPDCPANPGDDEWERNTPVWLRSVVGFRGEGPRRVLLDAADVTVATLTATAQAPGTLLLGARVAPDPPSAEQSTALDNATRPARSAAGPTDLPGTWLPEGAKAGVFVTFARNGSLHVRDGCNSGRGRWTVAAGGGLAVALSLSYVVACDNAPIAAWLQEAAWVTRDDRGLVLVDAGGHDVGRLNADY